ncbi:MAG TPA: crossover junction endodeoxyribonuclease RuvC [Candidatus Desulfofervidus auxilii]|uniref:Crossover junction endodeoxyribonuclease RuvC n=1 Tax=Desulfofervidus auxilii TaxID=1621989 RepID=A0A7V0NEA9_DESA2|nr:crossover junction endodeoxyribonuclease RuvC [Candidatus Desulfofervidus auxilii]
MKRIVGIDLGSYCSGYGIVEKEKRDYACITFGEIILPHKALPKRLFVFYEKMQEIIKAYLPHEMVIEDLYLSVNVKTAFTLGQIRGVTILLAEKFGLPVFAYSPLKVKKAVVGYGLAQKGQVRTMVKRLLNLTTLPPQHAADALAVALCHLNHSYL